uniref:NB-ARC domain-containing protein n=1 Tax=Leersia perrieri TaxID=77586 RepID=A0A0D9XQT1_9ORYZ
MAKELDNLLITIMPQFRWVIKAAEGSPRRVELERWLWKLKEAFYDAEDLLDMHEYELLRCKATGNSSTSLISAPVSAMSNLLPANRKVLRKLNELKNILVEARIFHQEFLSSGATAGIAGPHFDSSSRSTITTTSFPTSKVFGRDADRDRVLSFLCSPDVADASGDRKYSTVAIVGLGGMGKTTLAQYVYNDERVMNRFDVRMWICISRKLDLHRHTAEILESATQKNQYMQYANLDALQCMLRGILQNSQRFLLVLDDVWFDGSFENEEEWGKLLAPLVSQKQGSQVLVTSRSAKLPAPFHCIEVLELQDMVDTEFLALFKSHAFAGEQMRDQHISDELHVIAEQIAQKLGRSPLAAKAVGYRLSRKKTPDAWEGHPYLITELVHLWVAEGFVNSPEGFVNLPDQSKTLENIARAYFREMPVCTRFTGPSHYSMHDIIHDLAETLSRRDCFRLEDSTVTEIPHTVRHLSIYVDKMEHHKQSICRLIHLRTLICMEPVMDDVNNLFHEVLCNLKKLRVLVLCFYNSSELPQTINKLKYLHYLNIFETSISKVPGSLCTLYHLQFLRVHRDVEILPKKICNLSKLTKLQGDVEFCVAKQEGHELRQLRDMTELRSTLEIKNLENVRTKAEASEAILQNKSHLYSLQLTWSCTHNLYVDDSLHLEVLEGLKPPHELRSLGISGYRSPVYPSWLLEASHIAKLEALYLENCTALEGLPSGVQPIKHFYKIFLMNMPNLKTLPRFPGRLGYLHINGCPLLVFISSEELGQHEQHANLMRTGDLSSQLAMIWEAQRGSKKCRYSVRDTLMSEHSSMKKLMELMDADISSQLQTMESALQSENDKALVEENAIEAWLSCQEQRAKLIYSRLSENLLLLPSSLSFLTLTSCSLTDGALAVCLQGLTSLSWLSISQIMSLTSFPSPHVLQSLNALKNLDIRSCWCLRSLGGLPEATSLSELVIESCVSLELVGGNGMAVFPSSLEQLSISGCVLGADFLSTDFSHLRSISIAGCRSSESLTIGRLHSLKSLSLINMPDLCSLEGLSCPHLQDIHLINVPKLTVESFSQHHTWKSLAISSSDMLSLMLSVKDFVFPEKLCSEQYNESSITFASSTNFTSVKSLEFSGSNIMSLTGSLESLSCLERIKFAGCPNLSSLPDFPKSLQQIEIRD